jgi:hypothetical protein
VYFVVVEECRQLLQRREAAGEVLPPRSEQFPPVDGKDSVLFCLKIVKKPRFNRFARQSPFSAIQAFTSFRARAAGRGLSGLKRMVLLLVF